MRDGVCRYRVGLVTQLSKWIYDQGRKHNGSKMLRMNSDIMACMLSVKIRHRRRIYARICCSVKGATKDLSGLHVTAREIKPASSWVDHGKLE